MKLKIAVVGPKASGKSQISNFLAGQAESPVSERYEPTVGVRIVETELSGNNNQHLQVELWDASGDHRYFPLFITTLIQLTSFPIRYEACWKAIMHEADGIIIIYNPDAPSQDQQLLDWFDFFVKKNNLKEEQCLIFAHRINPTTERFRPRKHSLISILHTIFHILCQFNLSFNSTIICQSSSISDRSIDRK
jgi:Rab-like protein 5